MMISTKKLRISMMKWIYTILIKKACIVRANKFEKKMFSNLEYRNPLSSATKTDDRSYLQESISTFNKQNIMKISFSTVLERA